MTAESNATAMPLKILIEKFKPFMTVITQSGKKFTNAEFKVAVSGSEKN